MNNLSAATDIRLIEYQANKLQELIGEVHSCCKDRFAREARVFKLPQAELKCLMLFEGHKYLTGMEIAGLLEVAKSRATVIIDNLETRSLVQRSADPNDARVKLISLTPAGQRKVREIEEFMFDLHQQLLGQIDPDQRAGVIAALETLRSSMEAVKAQFSK
ncbi:MAG: winged helix-turn-helix transcriptional regulator [Deltaproteobacteria bacterium]|jgi:DNA-binding MarR family transcriptional regulator|nr:winged helix-turn-helix transcriptional regulator [Deltaproteobacteria bacterium]